MRCFHISRCAVQLVYRVQWLQYRTVQEQSAEKVAPESEVPPRKARTRRGAVSGSVMTEEQATSYVKKVRE